MRTIRKILHAVGLALSIWLMMMVVAVGSITAGIVTFPIISSIAETLL